MEGMDEINATDLPSVFSQIRGADLSEAQKLARAFGWVTNRMIEYQQQEIDLARAMNDCESMVKEQIKLSMIHHARAIFQDCYRFMIGGSAWDEQNDR